MKIPVRFINHPSLRVGMVEVYVPGIPEAIGSGYTRAEAVLDLRNKLEAVLYKQATKWRSAEVDMVEV